MTSKSYKLLKDKGFWFTLLLSATVLAIFFGKLLAHPNHVFFSRDGDGFQTYYTALYHILHDPHYGSQVCMNYPFHESVFFTGCEPVISNPLRWLNSFCPVALWLPGITNLTMLFSLVACSAFLYLIFRRLGISLTWAVLFAVGITYMSPQIGRLQGHYNLTYQFAIPFFIYQLMVFYESPSLRKSIITGLVVFLLAATHLYFFGFFCFLSLFYWVVLFLKRKAPFNQFRFVSTHVLFQLILPFVLLQLSIYALNDVYDRTTAPWGILVYKSSIDGIFFPFGKFYEDTARLLRNPAYTEWEGLSYVGLFGLVTLPVMLLIKFKKGSAWKERLNIFQLSDHALLNIFFWASVMAALYACGYVLCFKLKFFLDYLGVLRQMRGIGRFAWLFYYMLNITAVYVWYQWLRQKNKSIRLPVSCMLVGLLYTDAIGNIYKQQDVLNNEIPQWEDHNNTLPDNAWMQQLNTSGFQAILPLPFFHVGSENWGRPPADGNISLVTQLVSLKTGLPMVSMTSSRSSLSQSWMNVQFGLENYRPLKVLQYYPTHKDLLVLAWPNLISAAEKDLLQKCIPMQQSPAGYFVYRLPWDSLLSVGQNLFEKHTNTFNSQSTYPLNGFWCNDSLASPFIYKSFDTQNAGGLHSKGCLCVDANTPSVLVDTVVSRISDSDLVCSFWMKDIDHDLHARTFAEIYFIDSSGSAFKLESYFVARNMVAAGDGWALIEIPFRFVQGTQRLRILVYNEDLPKHSTHCFDELLIRPASCHVYEKGTNYIRENNRYYYKSASSQ